MNQLPVNFTLYYPTLEQLISFAGYYSLFVIFCQIILLVYGFLLMVNRNGFTEGFLSYTSFMVGLPGYCFLWVISMLPFMKNFDWSDGLVYSVMFSSPFVVFYLSAWAGIV